MNANTTVEQLLLTVGAPLLVGFYFVEGLLIGKLLHPSVLFILYVVVSNPGLPVTALVGLFCVLSATLGQLLLYRGFNDEVKHDSYLYRKIPFFDRLPTIVKDRIGVRRIKLINRQFDRFGGHAIWLSNATPGFRGLMTIVAGLNSYPQRRFVLLSAFGNVIYMILLIAVANGVLETLQFIPWNLSPEAFLSAVRSR